MMTQSQPEHGISPEAEKQVAYAEHYGRLHRSVEARGERAVQSAGEYLILPRVLVTFFDFDVTQAVTLENNYDVGFDSPTVIIRTLELGPQGDRDDFYHYLAQRAWGTPEAGAWFWRETKIEPPYKGLSQGSSMHREYIAHRMAQNPQPQPGHDTCMRQLYPLFTAKYSATGDVRPELARLAEMLDVLEQI